MSRTLYDATLLQVIFIMHVFCLPSGLHKCPAPLYCASNAMFACLVASNRMNNTQSCAPTKTTFIFDHVALTVWDLRTTFYPKPNLVTMAIVSSTKYPIQLSFLWIRYVPAYHMYFPASATSETSHCATFPPFIGLPDHVYNRSRIQHCWNNFPFPSTYGRLCPLYLQRHNGGCPHPPRGPYSFTD